MSQADAAARAALDRLVGQGLLYADVTSLERYRQQALEDGNTVLSQLTALEAKVERLSKGWNNTAVKHNDLLAEVAALRQDAERWRAVRDDLAVDRDKRGWRIVGNNYDAYVNPPPASIDEAADRVVVMDLARAALSPSAPRKEEPDA